MNDDERVAWFRGHDDGLAGNRTSCPYREWDKMLLQNAYSDGYREGVAKRREAVAKAEKEKP